jgi:hypothetical protein
MIRPSGSRHAMRPIIRPDYSPTKIVLTLWGIVAALQGAARSAGSDPQAPNSNWTGAFLFFSYYSVLAIGIFGFVSSRVVSILLSLSTALALGILVLNRPFENGLGLGLSFHSALGVILLRPALAAVLFFVISRSERTLNPSRRAQSSGRKGVR